MGGSALRVRVCRDRQVEGVEEMIDDDKLVEIIEKAISDNFESITDPSLYDAVYMVGMDVADAVGKAIKEGLVKAIKEEQQRCKLSPQHKLT